MSVSSGMKKVDCESCHGPAASHAANPIESKPSIPAEREFCLRCHSYNPARPSGFPQIDPEEHNSPIPCATCHEPHAPVTPVTPGSCTACHGQIERQKAVSHHASLACTTCHQSPDEHKDNPRAVRPTKPTERAFCGTCHTSGDDRYVPQVDLGNHNPRYVCWQCHYPHFPETE